MGEAIKSRMAPGAIMPNHQLLSIAYILQGDSALSPEKLCEDIGLHYAGLSGLFRLVQTWREEFQVHLAQGATAGDLLKVPAGWQPTPLVGAPKVTAAVINSLDAFCAGKSVAAIAAQRERPILASTAEGYLNIAFQNAHPKVMETLPRFQEFFPKRGEVDRFDQAMMALGMELSSDDHVSLKDLI